MNVKDAMTESVRAVLPQTSLKDVAATLAEHSIGGVPVVDTERHVLGVVTKADILVKERAETPYRGVRGLFHRRERNEVATKIGARTAEEAMASPAVTVEPWWSLASAAELMLDCGVNRLPVTEHGQLVGMITRHDLVRAFARPDAELEQEIREEAFRGLSWTDGVRMTVQDGEVTLRGELDTRYDAQVLPTAIRRIPGVVSVDAHLTGWDPQSQRKVEVATQL